MLGARLLGSTLLLDPYPLLTQCSTGRWQPLFKNRLDPLGHINNLPENLTQFKHFDICGLQGVLKMTTILVFQTIQPDLQNNSSITPISSVLQAPPIGAKTDKGARPQILGESVNLAQTNVQSLISDISIRPAVQSQFSHVTYDQ